MISINKQKVIFFIPLINCMMIWFILFYNRLKSKSSGSVLIGAVIRGAGIVLLCLFVFQFITLFVVSEYMKTIINGVMLIIISYLLSAVWIKYQEKVFKECFSVVSDSSLS